MIVQKQNFSFELATFKLKDYSFLTAVTAATKELYEEL